MSTEIIAPTLKRIDFSLGHFPANGKTYFIQPGTFSIKRRAIFDTLSLDALFDMSGPEIFKSYKKVYQLLTSGNSIVESHSKAVLEIYNRMNQFNQAAERGFINPKPYVKLCTLFVNASGEDISDWNEELAIMKINDWEKEGIDDKDFFLLGINSFPDYIQMQQNIHQEE